MTMARQLRIEFEGAMYHVLARGDRRENIFLANGDFGAFLKALGQMCQRTGIVVHAYALMSNHYHLVIETPNANLVEGMQWLQNTYTRRFNVCHGLWGHLFGGRYKALVIDSEGEYFRRVVDYVHLNPARAGLVDLMQGLDAYRWSSLYQIVHGGRQRPQWLRVKDVLAALDLRDTARGRKAYLGYLEERVRQEGAVKAGEIAAATMPGQSLQATIRRGWYFGSEEFKERLLALLDASTGMSAGAGAVAAGYGGSQWRDRGKDRAERLIAAGCRRFGVSREELRARKLNDPDKLLIAELLAAETSVSLDWLRKELRSGSRSYCSRLVGEQKRRLTANGGLRRKRQQLLRSAINNG